MGMPFLHRMARESPQLATTIRLGPTTATTAVEPTCSLLGVCISHRQLAFRGPPHHLTTASSIRQKLLSITSLHFSAGGGGHHLTLSNSSATISCIRSLHDTAT